MEFNKKDFELLRKDIEEAIGQVEEKHNVKLSTGKIKYGQYDFTMELKAIKTDLGIDVEQEEFNKYCILFGFEKSDYKRELKMQGKIYYLVGFNLNSPKNNCTILSLDGKRYRTNDGTVKRTFATI